jgi:hypothetical protein
LIEIHLAGLAAADDVAHGLIICPHYSWGSEGRISCYPEEVGGCDGGGVAARGWGLDYGARCGLPATGLVWVISDGNHEGRKAGTETGDEHWRALRRSKEDPSGTH